MLRSMWKGTIAFGLVTIPVKLYTAAEQNEVSFHQCHAADGGRVKMLRVCSECGKTLPYDEIAKGYEADDGHNVIISQAELDALPIDTLKAIKVEKFVPQDDIPLIYYSGRTYYIAPEPVGQRAYALLRQALTGPHAHGLAAITRVTLRQRERLAVLRVDGDVLMLSLLSWADEIREPAIPLVGERVQLSSSEVTMARKLVASMTGKFDADEHADSYRAALTDLVSAKLSSRAPATAKAAKAAPAPDLASALEASLREVGRGRKKK